MKPGGTAFIIDNDLCSGTFASWVRAAHDMTNDEIDDVERFWIDSGFTIERLASRWRFQNRDDFERVVHLDFPADHAERFFGDHSGLEVDCNLLLIHRTYACGLDSNWSEAPLGLAPSVAPQVAERRFGRRPIAPGMVTVLAEATFQRNGSSCMRDECAGSTNRIPCRLRIFITLVRSGGASTGRLASSRAMRSSSGEVYMTSNRPGPDATFRKLWAAPGGTYTTLPATARAPNCSPS